MTTTRFSKKVIEKLSRFVADKKFGVLANFNATNKFIEATDGVKWARLTFGFGERSAAKLLPIETVREAKINLDEQTTLTNSTIYPDTEEKFVNRLIELQGYGHHVAVSARHLKEICELAIANADEEDVTMNMYLDPNRWWFVGLTTISSKNPKLEVILAAQMHPDEKLPLEASKNGVVTLSPTNQH